MHALDASGVLSAVQPRRDVTKPLPILSPPSYPFPAPSCLLLLQSPSAAQGAVMTRAAAESAEEAFVKANAAFARAMALQTNLAQGGRHAVQARAS